MSNQAEQMKAMVLNHLNDGRARDDLIHLAYQFLADFPPETYPEELNRCQVLKGLERIYDQITTSNTPSNESMNHNT